MLCPEQEGSYQIKTLNMPKFCCENMQTHTTNSESQIVAKTCEDYNYADTKMGDKSYSCWSLKGLPSVDVQRSFQSDNLEMSIEHI